MSKCFSCGTTNRLEVVGVSHYCRRCAEDFVPHGGKAWDNIRIQRMVNECTLRMREIIKLRGYPAIVAYVDENEGNFNGLNQKRPKTLTTRAK